MAFLDNLGKRASEATAKVVQKAQDLSDTARLNGLIGESEKRIRDMYCQIGEKYADLHSGDSEPALSEMIAAVNSEKAKIKEYQRQIQDIKGLLTCRKCGAEIAKNAAFCSACGAPVPPPPAPEEARRCGACGARVEDWMRFCTSCGKPVPGREDAAAPQDSPEPPAPREAQDCECPGCAGAVSGE